MSSRSPLGGRNQSVRYGGHLWHVQTEDSGVAHARIFTHLFHDGTILASRRTDYEPGAPPDEVREIMDTQHRAMLEDLERGALDERLERHVGEPLDKREHPQPARLAERAAPTAARTERVARPEARGEVPPRPSRVNLGSGARSARATIVPDRTQSLHEVIIEDLSRDSDPEGG